MEGPLRVWLEPGYDGGRVGCWMLDLPGCFTWGRTRAIALARAPSAAARFSRWLADYGERAELPQLDETLIVEEVAAVGAGDRERNAVFAADRRAVTEEELETTLRRLNFARADLLRLAGRADRLEAVEAADSLGERDQRSGTDVLRHLAGSEAWLAGRLDPDTRYEGPPRDGDVAEYLAATRAWATSRLRELFARDPAMARDDRAGEGWTLAKVMRRLVYHSLDHLDELDRRLALAEGRLEWIRVERNGRVDPAELAELLRMAGLHRGRRSPQQVARMLAATKETVSAWDGDRLVGFARAISDGVTNAYISSVAVDARWQDRGLGGRLIESLIDGREGMKFVLTARDGTQDFYRRFGFEPDPRVLVRQRHRAGGG